MARTHTIIPPLSDNDLSRFWTKVHIHWNDRDACWLWQAGVDASGYGRFQMRTKYLVATRIAFQIANGNLDPCLCVLHTCDTPACCNPRHLFLGTDADNVHDAMAKGRRRVPATGESHPRAKLSAADVTDVRKMLSAGVSHRKIAASFGVSKSAVTWISNGKHWRGATSHCASSNQSCEHDGG